MTFGHSFNKKKYLKQVGIFLIIGVLLGVVMFSLVIILDKVVMLCGL